MLRIEFAELIRWHVKPAAIYNALLDICARTRDEQRGNDVIARMAASQVSPDEWTWETVKNRKALRSQLRRTFGPP